MTDTVAAAAAKSRSTLWSAGPVAGIVGGVCYTAFIEAVTIVAQGTTAAFLPFRQIGAVVLGPAALDPGYDLTVALAAGSVLHLAISAAFGLLVAWIGARLIGTRGGGRLVALGLAAGLALYAADVFAIFPAAFPWFLANDRLTQSLGHALFGAVTGAWLAWRRPA